MSSDGDNKLKDLDPSFAGTASELFAPSNPGTENANQSGPDIQGKTTLSDFLKKETAVNSYQPPDDDSSDVQNIETKADYSWKIGPDANGAEGPHPRQPFMKVMSNLELKLPLGRYVKVESNDTRIGTVSYSLDDNNHPSESHEGLLATETKSPHSDTAGAPDEDGTVHQSISHALSYNRFSPTKDSPFVIAGKKQSLGWSIQKTMGTWNPDELPPSESEIQKIGRRLSLLQTGHGQDETVMATLGPTQTQMGLGSSRKLHDLLNLRSLVDGVTKNDDTYTHLDSRINDDIGTMSEHRDPKGTPLSSLSGDQTYGALNSYQEQFEGELGIFIIVAIQLVILILIGFLLELFFGDGSFSTGETRTADQKGLRGSELNLGTNKPIPINSKTSGLFDAVKYAFGYPDSLEYKFGDAFTQGLVGFYGIDPDDIISDPAGAFMSLWESTGFYAVMIRFINQDMMDYSEIGAAWNIGMPTHNDPITSIFKTMSLMKNSQTIKFVFRMAELGSTILGMEDGRYRNRQKEMLSGGPHSNSKFLGAAASGGMLLGSLKLSNLSNRFGTKNLGSYLAPSLTGIGNTADGDDDEVASNIFAGTTDIYRHETQDPYIDTETRKKYEKALNSTYCPFYFHDLRTNEIVSFHAFLINLADSYSVNYDDITGIGRIEPAKIYQSSTRTLSISFKVLAVTPDDMDAMYMKLNRLTSMCYPQYTAGRAVALGDEIARAPFSQMASGTPLIRLKIGDVIGTNSSKMGLSRLFGSLDAEEAKPSMVNIDQPNAGDSISWGTEQTDRPNDSRILRGHERIYFCPSGDVHPSNVTVMDLCNHSKGVHPLPFTVEFGVFRETSNGMKIIQVTSFKDANDVNIDVATFEAFLKNENYWTPQPDEGKWKDGHPGQTGSKPAGSGGLFEPIELGIPLTDIDPGPGNGYSGFGSVISAKGENKILGDGKIEFETGKMSSLARSFEETGGQGLPGVITSLDLGNLTEATWGTEHGYRAPKFLDITVSFAVVHDIPPGLDSQGHMNSALYGVGASKAYNQGDF